MPPQRAIRKGTLKKPDPAAASAKPSVNPQRLMLRAAVERTFCGYACCVRQQTTPEGVVACSETFAEHLMPDQLPFLENASLLQEQLPCPPCVGNDGLCCKDAAEAAGPDFELFKLRQVGDIRRIEREMQGCAVHAKGATSACVQSSAACAREHLESYARHAGGTDDYHHLPADAVVACQRKAVRECGYDGKAAATPCSLRCVLGLNPETAADAVERLRGADLPPGCTVSKLVERSFS